MEKLLIVEDDIISSRIFSQILNNEGYNSVAAMDGIEALDILSHNERIRICFLDLNMPRMDGYAFLQKLSSQTSIKNIDIYITSANSKQEFFEKANGMHIDLNIVKGFFEKPYNANEIVRMLKNYN